ncbi:sensor histidine kinase [Herbidospora sp. NBRC 101105]|uniref:sensor histidine kinase n=1 Tax=Herbidospora sp. NBRC 101105 TaxID=3032195 RepID=UPI0024A5E778|nr:sensor histidine kinase [Herbidospora sp. NBRC 101105]GLX96988.1 two-component sensor histidine kinase [Herbidospora sp. NBRC 101105]
MRTSPRRQLISDSVLAVVVTASSLLFVLSTGPGSGGWEPPSAFGTRPADWFSLLLVVSCTLPLVFRRRWPFLILLATTVPALVLNGMGYHPGLADFAAVILLYTVATLRGLALSVLAAVVVMAGYLAGALPDTHELGWADHAVVVVVTALVWVVGRTIRLRRAYLGELVDRADRLERAREADTRAARAEERSRIARELHDVVAHHVSVMTVQAAAARTMLEKDPAVARDALVSIEEMGRTAMAEMRNIVGVLRTDGPAERGPQPGMDDLPGLVDQMREAGLTTQLWLEGETRQLPPGVDLAAYRLVQEALTNSLRHAGPAARAWVTVRHEPSELMVHVEDDGRGLVLKRENGGKGHGLVGIKERVALYGGVLRIGPRPGGGFEVRARFPLKDR